MTITHIIRPPSILSTPKRLADAIESIQVHRPLLIRRQSSMARRGRNESTIRLFYSSAGASSPNQRYPLDVDNPFTFFSLSKGKQRERIRLQGIPTVPSATSLEEARNLPDYGHGYVVRKLRHSQGRSWRQTSNHEDFNPQFEYIQSLVSKRREYRAILCRGNLIALLSKRGSERNSLIPWNHHQGCHFITVEPERSYLRNTEIFTQISSSSLLCNTDLVGVDIIQDEDNNPFVLEFNSCPSLSIESNLNKVAQFFVNNSLGETNA